MRLEVTAALARARSWGRCEGCGSSDGLDVHHRMARGSGGVHRAAADVANDVRSLLVLCRTRCHALTLDQPAEAIERGWVVERRAGVDPRFVPALIHTPQGYGWWYLLEDGGYAWATEANMISGFRLEYSAQGPSTE